MLTSLINRDVRADIFPKKEKIKLEYDLLRIYPCTISKEGERLTEI